MRGRGGCLVFIVGAALYLISMTMRVQNFAVSYNDKPMVFDDRGYQLFFGSFHCLPTTASQLLRSHDIDDVIGVLFDLLCASANAAAVGVLVLWPTRAAPAIGVASALLGVLCAVVVPLCFAGQVVMPAVLAWSFGMALMGAGVIVADVRDSRSARERTTS